MTNDKQKVDFPGSGENVCEKTIPQSAVPTAPFAQGSLTNDRQKDRLVELLKLPSNCMPNAECKSCGLNGVCTVHQQANQLLANGVVVPPYKVGDMAHFLLEDEVVSEKYISSEPITDVCTKGFYTSWHVDSDENGDLWLWSDVGRIVFLDKAKAEEALSKLQASCKQVNGGVQG